MLCTLSEAKGIDINMKEITERNCCTGCGVCLNICPVDCIMMQNDEEGFVYPQINQMKCVDCGLCRKCCPNNQLIEERKKNVVNEVKAYACYSVDETMLEQSSSGGFFGECAKYVLDQDGIVYGAAWDKEFQVEHIKVENVHDLEKIQQSKYVQSTISDSYRKVKKDLVEGRKVLFSGTPCQIAGLKSYLSKDYDNLICMDFVCHGIPSPGIWKRYLKEKTRGKEISRINFRAKRPYWKAYKFEISYSDGVTENEYIGENVYMKAFLKNVILRPACFQCKYKGIVRESDITMADCWGIWNINSNLYNKKGVSLVIEQNEKGKKLRESVAQNLVCEEIEISQVIKYNCSMVNVEKEPFFRKKFYDALKKNEKVSTIELLVKYTREPKLFQWIKWFIGGVKIVLGR